MSADCAGTAGTNLKVSVVSGGARGDNAVTFRAETAGETALAVDTTAICFWVPDLSVTLAPSGMRYLGINVEGYAYGVVRGAGTESSIGRVTCESAATGSCAIFVDCTDQAGMD